MYWLFEFMKGGVKMQRRKQEIPRVFRVVVAAAIIKEETVLLLQRKDDEEIYPGLWELPSGKREFNETSMEALIREVKEESGLSIVVERPISIFEYLVKTPTEVRDTTQINFLARPANLQEMVKINKKEHQTARWFTKEELLSLQNISEETRKCAQMALENQP
jgi:8-oxo-dGTP diphosphatase